MPGHCTRIGAALSGILLGALLGLAASADARADNGDGDAPFGRGRWHVGLSAGWGHGFEPEEQPQDDVRMLAFVPRVGVGLTDALGGGAWYRGSFDLSLEPQLFANFEPKEGFAGGAALLLRYHFLAGGRLVPFVGLGGGALGLEFDGEHQDDGFNFILQGGAGAHWLIRERTALTFDARWHHVSNAHTRSPNKGIDSALFLVGVTWFLD